MEPHLLKLKEGLSPLCWNITIIEQKRGLINFWCLYTAPFTIRIVLRCLIEAKTQSLTLKVALAPCIMVGLTRCILPLTDNDVDVAETELKEGE